MKNDRLLLSLLMVVLMVGSLVCARNAIAGKMVFLASSLTESVDLKASFSPETGKLFLDPKGTHVGALNIEIVDSSGRSPSSLGLSAAVVKRFLLTKPIAFNVASLAQAHSAGTIQIRVLAP